MERTRVVSVVAQNPDVSAGKPESVVWKLGSAVPGTEGKDTAIVQRMYYDEEIGELEVFGAPVQGSELQRMGHCFHFRITPQAVKLICTIVPMAEWQAWIKQAEDEADAAEKEEEAPVQAAPPATVRPLFPTSVPSLTQPPNGQ